LQGRGSSGKSETIRKVFEKLKKKYNVPDAQIQKFNRGPVNIKIVMSGVKGKKIGFGGFGDDFETLRQNIADFIESGCDIIFCPCRTAGRSYECVEKFKADNKVDYTPQNVLSAPPFDKSNDAMADTLIKKAGL